MLEKVSAVYPNTYRGMDDRQRARTIDEWYRSLEKYPVQLCQRAWEKYRNTMKIRELNIAYFVGIVKDIQEADWRDHQRKELTAPDDVKHDSNWEDARKKCMEKCGEVFGRKF